MLNLLFNFIDDTRLSTLIVGTFNKIIFKNDSSISSYRLNMTYNVKAICCSNANKILFNYIYFIFLFLLSFNSGLILIIKIFFTANQNILILSCIYYLIISVLFFMLTLKIILGYLIHYHHKKCVSIEDRFKLTIFYMPYEDGGEYSEEYRNKYEVFSGPEDGFNFCDVREISIEWYSAMEEIQKSQDECLVNEFFSAIAIENEKAEPPYPNHGITFFNLYAYHSFRYVAAKKLLLQFQFYTHKKSNILIIFFTMIFFSLELLI